MGVGAQEKPQANQHATRQGNPEWPELVLEPPGQDKRKCEDYHRDGENIGSLCTLPPELFLQRGHEHTPGTECAQRNIHREPAHHPPPATYVRLWYFGNSNLWSCHFLISSFA